MLSLSYIPRPWSFLKSDLELHVLSESLIYATDKKTRVFRAYHSITESTLLLQEEVSGNDLKLTLKTLECIKNPPVGGSELKDT